MLHLFVESSCLNFARFLSAPPPQKSFLSNFWGHFTFQFVSNGLLPDAELAENVAEHFVGGDLAGDFAQVVEAFAQVLRQKIA